jgi:hypothetical protein
MSKYVKVDAGVLQLVRNCLQRDADEGKQSRKEILDELNKNTFILFDNAVTFVEVDGLYKAKCGSTEFVSGDVISESGNVQQAVIYKTPFKRFLFYLGYTYTNEEEFNKAANDVFVFKF